MGSHRRVVVVRYVTPTPPPTAPPPAPAPSPTLAPTPAPAAAPYQDHYIAGDYLISPKVYNEFSPGNSGRSGSYAVRGALEFNLFNLPWMLAGDFRQYQYPHNCGLATDPQCNVTTIGGTGSTFVPAFTAKDTDVDARFGLKVADPAHLHRRGLSVARNELRISAAKRRWFRIWRNYRI